MNLSSIKAEKQLCTEEDCFNTVTIDELTERLPDGTPHPRALKCWDCETVNDRKALKRYRVKRRKQGLALRNL